MKPSIVTLVPCIAAILVSGDGRAQNQPIGYDIAAIQAKLFYENRGRFSANIIDNPKIVLWNVVIGEGTVEGPSSNTLLIVRLQGPPRIVAEGLKLHVFARTERDTLVDREIEVGPMNSTGNYYAPFWLEDTGCFPVVIDAQLTLGNKHQRRSAHIPFACGE
ncbi:MAG: hypothetical protein AAB290_06445 [Candidatus Eisenbacteria bacterium]